MHMYVVFSCNYLDYVALYRAKHPPLRGVCDVLFKNQEVHVMRHLDYTRLLNCNDSTLRTFLLSVFNQDTVCRVQVAFPEYFAEIPNKEPVHIDDVRVRMEALQEYPVEHIDRLCMTFEWFGLELYVFEYRSDDQKQNDIELLPKDFVLERDEGYDGLYSDDPWVVSLSRHDGQSEQHLVLTVLPCDHEATEYLIWTISIVNLFFEKEE